MSNESSYEALLLKARELADLDAVIALLSWDEEVCAPPGGRATRGQYSATIEAIRHQRLVDPRLGELIDAALDSDRTDDERTLVRRLAKKRDRATKVPESLVKAMAKARSEGLNAWGKAKEEGRFQPFEEPLGRIFDLLREQADALGSETGDRYDALLDEYEPGFTAERLGPVFDALRKKLVPLVEAIGASSKRPNLSFLNDHPFDVDDQWAFTLQLLKELGFDFERGRQDRSAHPFSQSIGPKDNRLTTRLDPEDPFGAIFSTIHECGHGLYEQGFDPVHFHTPLGEAASMGLHESQSRLWENHIARSRAFWTHHLPKFAERFPGPLNGVDLDQFYFAVNRVEPSLIRTESDEVTYNLHIILRFELERALLSKDLSIKDLPSAWNDRMKSDLGVDVPSDKQGCLQDIHWAVGAVGYFPTYTIGNLYAAQLYSTYERMNPNFWSDIEAGRFAPLLSWLRDKIHRRGHTQTAEVIMQDAVGQPLGVDAFVDYLYAKFGPLYGLN